VYGGGEALIGLVVTCRDAPELLEPLEAVLDMPLAMPLID